MNDEKTEEYNLCYDELGLKTPFKENPKKEDKYIISGLYKQKVTTFYREGIIVKRIDSRYGYNNNLKWVEIYHSELNLED